MSIPDGEFLAIHPGRQASITILRNLGSLAMLTVAGSYFNSTDGLPAGFRKDSRRPMLYDCTKLITPM